jgi:hypothetical protein
MAVTIHSEPQSITPSDNPIVWTFSSNQTAQANFSYIIEAYVNGVLDSRHEVFPEVGARAHFDMSSIMSVNTPVATVTQSTVAKNASNVAECNITIRERYGTPPTYQSDADSSTVHAFKASLSPEQMEGFDFMEYAAPGVPDPFRFLTFNTNDLYIPPDKDYFLSFFPFGESTLFVSFQLFEEDGTSIPGSDIAIPDTFEVIQLNLRTSFLVAESIIPQSSFDAAAYMEVFVNQGGGDPISETKRIYFDRSECGTPTHFVWLNSLGGFDVYNFSHNRIYLALVESFRYGKQFGEWQGTSFVLDASNSGTIDYLKKTNKRMQAVSGYIDEPTQNYLVDSMYGSPLCYISEAGEFTRVTVEATAYELQNDLFEDEFTETVEVSFPNAKYSQRL